MLSYYLKCKMNTDRKNPKFSATSNGKIMLFSRCAVCAITAKLRFIKEQEVSVQLSQLKFRTPLSKIPLSGGVLS